MQFLHSLIYGLLSGLAEFLPTSGQALQAFLMQLFGIEHRQPLLDLMVHSSLIVALLTACRSMFMRIRRDQSVYSGRGRSASIPHSVSKSMQDLRVVRTTAIPMVLLFLGYLAAAAFEFKIIALFIILIVNGIILFVSEHIRHGNKDAKTVTGLEAVLIGAVTGLSLFPGISRIGACISASMANGVERQNGANWALMLSLPALVLFVAFDLVGLFVYGFGSITFLIFLGYVVAALMAFVGGYISILLLRFVVEHTGLIPFAFYSWGLGLFMFFLYLIT